MKKSELQLPTVGEKRTLEDMEGDLKQGTSKKVSSVKAIDISETVFEKLKKKRNAMLFDCSDQHVQETSRFLADVCRPLDNFIEVRFFFFLSLGFIYIHVLWHDNKNKSFQTFLEAEDPENGIEEEYHPKKSQWVDIIPHCLFIDSWWLLINSLFCWRTRRLMAEKDLSVFALMGDGDIGKVSHDGQSSFPC